MKYKKYFGYIFALIFSLSVVFSIAIFIFLTKIKQNKGLNLYLPESDSYIFKDIEQQKGITIQVDEDVKMYIDSEEINSLEILNILKQKTQNKEDNIYLEINENINYKNIISLVDLLKNEGYINITLITN